MPGPDGGAQVGGTECQHPQPRVRREWNTILDLLHSLLEATEHLAHVPPRLHADEPEVVLLPAPHQEGLAVVVENTATCRPVSAGIGRLEEPVPFLVFLSVLCSIFVI